MTNPLQETSIVYDGECPFCSRYVSLLRIRDAIGPVALVDARNGGPVVAELRSLGYNLDAGMVLTLNGEIYYAADCIHRLALLSSGATWFNRMNALVFSNPTLSRGWYPILRAGRRAALWLLGRELLGDAQKPQRQSKKPFRRYQTRMQTLFLCLLVYPFIAEAHRLPILKNYPAGAVGEIFPFFRWSLFSRADRYNARFTIVPVDVFDGSPLKSVVNRPVEVDDASFVRDVRFQKTMRRLADVIDVGDESQIQSAKAQIDNFVKPYGVKTYRVVELIVDPLVLDWSKILSTTEIAQFDLKR
jgi:predicted DCC family thiol-disulfide oxidoreductase YuxK